MACEHRDFEARVTVLRKHADAEMTEVANFVAHVQVACAECGERFGFRGLTAGGVDGIDPRVTPDAMVVALPLMSQAELAIEQIRRNTN